MFCTHKGKTKVNSADDGMGHVCSSIVDHNRISVLPASMCVYIVKPPTQPLNKKIFCILEDFYF